VGGVRVGVDQAGYVTELDGREVSYTGFGKVASIARAGRMAEFSYNADGERVLKAPNDSDPAVVTLGSRYERRINSDGTAASTTWRILAEDRVVAQLVGSVDAEDEYVTSEQYLHDDAQGSTVVLTASDGVGSAVVARSSSDAWGRARTAESWSTPQPDADAAEVSIGFTGHKAELDHGLIDANGRMYDPSLGRFTSADPLVGDPYGSQAYNRYAYVGNRPLRFTDPTGWSAQGDDESAFAGGSDQFEEAFDYLIGGFSARVGRELLNTYYEVGGAVASRDLRDVWTAGVVAPVEFIAARGLAQLSGLIEGALAIVANPQAAAAAFGWEIVRDAGNVLSAYGRIYDAVAKGDYSTAAEVYLDAAKSAWRLATLFAGTGAIASCTVAQSVLRIPTFGGDAAVVPDDDDVDPSAHRPTLSRHAAGAHRRIEIHEGYLENPRSKVPHFDSLRPGHQQSLIRRWSKEILDFADEQSIVDHLLRNQ